MENFSKSPQMKEIFTPFIRKNGRIIYPKNAKFFHFWVLIDPSKSSSTKQLSLFDKDDK